MNQTSRRTAPPHDGVSPPLAVLPRRRCRPRRSFVVVVPAEAWDALVEAAARVDRDPYQHARWLLLEALAKSDEDDTAMAV